MQSKSCSAAAITLVFCTLLHIVNCKHVVITAPEHALIGSTVKVVATLYDGDKIAKKGSYSFSWKDNAGHHQEIATSEPICNWTVTYAKDVTQAGQHKLEVSVSQEYFVWFPVAEGVASINLVDMLTGHLELVQNHKVRTNDFVSTQESVNHSITLWPADLDYLTSNHFYVNTYWFENGTYRGMSHSYDYQAIYSQPDQYYNFEAVVVASPYPLPEPTTSTTTTTTTTTTPATTTSTSTTPATTTTSSTAPPTTTKPTPTTTTTIAPKPSRSKRDLNQTMHQNAALLGVNLTAALQDNNNPVASVALAHPSAVRLQMPLSDIAPLFTLIDGNVVAQDPNKTYGYFQRRIVSKTPIFGFATSGKNWVQHWELTNLQINCKGSPPFHLCYQVYEAGYNVTGNETCDMYMKYDNCQIDFNRYFHESKTILFFIRNDVSENVNKVTITIYEAQRQSQLSVVVVPITCTLVAVCLVIFGVAYYMQSRNRFTVEVADFNFGETQSVDMEYKTFQQRLIDSIRDAWPWPRWRRYSQSSTDLIAEQPSSSDGYVVGVGDVDSNLRYNTFN